MSSYVVEVSNPQRERCPFHDMAFKKKGKFWHCPAYGQCGYSIGSRWREGVFNGMWLQQTKKGKAAIKAHYDNIRKCTEVLEDESPQTTGNMVAGQTVASGRPLGLHGILGPLQPLPGTSPLPRAP